MHKTTLVMLPGLDGTGTLFHRAIDHLPSFIKPIVMSYPPDKKLGYSDLVTIVQSAIENQIPTGDQYVLLGESFGGPLSLMLADQHRFGSPHQSLKLKALKMVIGLKRHTKR